MRRDTLFERARQSLPGGVCASTRLNTALGHPLYVVQQDPANNTVTLGPRDALAAVGGAATEASWHIEPSEDWIACTAQVRAHGQPLALVGERHHHGGEP